jgi:flagellar basal-body rod protein FlgB
MPQLYLFALASENAKWLHAREALVAGNVANASTPGYQGVDLKPFSAFLDRSGEAMAATNPAHLSPASFGVGKAQTVQSDASDTTLSGNSVSLETEMVKLGDINRGLSLNTNVQRVFHQMLMTALK